MKQLFLTTLTALALLTVNNVSAGESHTSTKFTGAKANKGTVTHTVESGKNVLTLSSDFVTPETPDPHWQVVDSHGQTYLLQRLMIKGDKLNRSITVPDYVPNIARVQIWCAWAEANLGEATFSQTIQVSSR